MEAGGRKEGFSWVTAGLATDYQQQLRGGEKIVYGRARQAGERFREAGKFGVLFR